FSYDMMENRTIAYRLENRNHEKSGITKNKEKNQKSRQKDKTRKRKGNGINDGTDKKYATAVQNPLPRGRGRDC
ncbi:hypothetical protein AAAY25_04200, partial [Brotaphodocola catenula]